MIRIKPQVKNYIIAILFGSYFSALFFFGPLWVTDTRVGWGWVLLAAGALVMAVGTVLFKPQLKFAPKSICFWLLGFLALAGVFSLLNGSTLLEERWTHRWVTLLFFTGLLQWFNSPKDLAASLRYPLLFFVLALCLESIYQNFYVCPASTVGTGCFSSRFYNINMLSQSLLLGVVLLEFLKDGAGRRTQWLFDAVVFLALAVIVYSQSRSAWIAILLFTFSRLFQSRKDFLRYFLSLVLLFAVFKLDPRETAGKKASDKAASTDYRKELVLGSVKMIAENPRGIGMNNFEFGFIPFRNEGTLEPTLVSIDKTPHSDFLLVLAEEGWVVGAAFLLLVSLLLLKAAKLIWAGSRALWPGFMVIMLPEILFQFPSDMHFFAFCAAVVLAIEVLAGPLVVRPGGRFLRAAFFAVAVLISAVGLVRYNTFTSAKYSPLYCSVFHDAWKNCGYYFNYHLQRGDYSRAEKTLVSVIKYQKFNYVMQHWDFLLYNPERNPVIACNYASLFNFQISIPISDIESCERSLTRHEITRRLTDYSRTR